VSSNKDAWWLKGTSLDTAWMVDGVCRQVDPDLFFPEYGQNVTKHARKVCASCPVMDECLAYALAHPGILGVWGGTSESERRVLRQREAA
jgi:WhiB family redox-sensing transcriptional regulator